MLLNIVWQILPEGEKKILLKEEQNPTILLFLSYMLTKLFQSLLRNKKIYKIFIVVNLYFKKNM